MTYPNEIKWCVRVMGPDDVYDMPSYAQAVRRAHEMNAYFLSNALNLDVMWFAYPCRKDESIQKNANRANAGAAMYEALKRIKDNIGWRSTQGEDADQYYCEFCGAHHLDHNLIEHDPDCAVTEVRAALAKAGATHD